MLKVLANGFQFIHQVDGIDRYCHVAREESPDSVKKQDEVNVGITITSATLDSAEQRRRLLTRHSVLSKCRSWGLCAPMRALVLFHFKLTHRKSHAARMRRDGQ